MKCKVIPKRIKDKREGLDLEISDVVERVRKLGGTCSPATIRRMEDEQWTGTRNRLKVDFVRRVLGMTWKEIGDERAEVFEGPGDWTFGPPHKDLWTNFTEIYTLFNPPGTQWREGDEIAQIDYVKDRISRYEDPDFKKSQYLFFVGKKRYSRRNARSLRNFILFHRKIASMGMDVEKMCSLIEIKFLCEPVPRSTFYVGTKKNDKHCSVIYLPDYKNFNKKDSPRQLLYSGNAKEALLLRDSFQMRCRKAISWKDANLPCLSDVLRDGSKISTRELINLIHRRTAEKLAEDVLRLPIEERRRLWAILANDPRWVNSAPPASISAKE